MLITGGLARPAARAARPAAAAEMDWVVAAISAIRAMRTEMNVPAGGARCRCCSRMPMPLRCSGSNATASTSIRLARVERIAPVETVPEGGVAAVVEGAT